MTTPPDTPPVSVVMIFRDARRFLDEAVRSVLGQTYPHVELLLVDDGSTDVARAHRRACPDRVRLLAHPGRRRRGMSASRNLGIDGARGELIAFLDADDVWEAGHLDHDVGLLLAHPRPGWPADGPWTGGAGTAAGHPTPRPPCRSPPAASSRRRGC